MYIYLYVLLVCPSSLPSSPPDQTKTLPVSNSDSTNEVIRLALQQFSIIVSEIHMLYQMSEYGE